MVVVVVLIVVIARLIAGNAEREGCTGFKGCNIISLSLKLSPWFVFFAAILGNTFSCTKKNLSDSYAAKFAARCRSCNYVAKVRIFIELCKYFRNYFCLHSNFLMTRFSTFPLFHFWHLYFLISRNGRFNIIYIIIYIILIINS